MKFAALRDGFTLIELSIVLVIIGLIVGGVLVGQSLITAAGVRATITQIEKFNTAANTFFTKYGYLPGDIPAGPAAQFGFVARSGARGHGDGNGMLDGFQGASYYGWDQSGENLFFWEDLSAAHLIDGGFATATDAVPATVTTTSVPSFDAYMPPAKLGGGNYFFTYSYDGVGSNLTGTNYFGLAHPNTINSLANLTASPALQVNQAYSLDLKIDDGLPISGRVTTDFISGNGGAPPLVHSPNAMTPSSSTCYDTTSNQYSVSQSNGSNVNCALSFRMQAGD